MFPCFQNKFVANLESVPCLDQGVLDIVEKTARQIIIQNPFSTIGIMSETLKNFNRTQGVKLLEFTTNQINFLAPIQNQIITCNELCEFL